MTVFVWVLYKKELFTKLVTWGGYKRWQRKKRL